MQGLALAKSNKFWGQIGFMRTFKVELKQETKIEGYLAMMNRF